MKNISLITFSKNRLQQVKRFFENNLKFLDKDDEVIFVDFNDPSNSKDYVKSIKDSRIKIIFINDVEFWQMSLARNLGGKHASKEILFFLDVDCLVEEKLISDIRTKVNKNILLRGDSQKNISHGSCAVTKENFYKVNGFEEMFTGYGGDDISFYDALGRNDVKCIVYDGQNKLIENAGWQEPAQRANWSWNVQLVKLWNQMGIKKCNFQRTWGRGGSIY